MNQGETRMTVSVRFSIGKLRRAIRRASPRLAAADAWWRHRSYRGRAIDDVFRDIHRKNAWRSRESVSGMGSERAGTRALRRHLPELLKRHGVRSMLDAPCGDFGWMAELTLDIASYHGVDIVAELVERLRDTHGDETHEFSVADITKDALPAVDLVLCRDCLVHLSYEHAFAALRRFRETGSRLLLTTTYPRLSRNFDAITGSWRALNLERPPFSFPPSLEWIDERSHEPYDRALGKSLGLWRMQDLP
jgi:hypothetical protein